MLKHLSTIFYALTDWLWSRTKSSFFPSPARVGKEKRGKTWYIKHTGQLLFSMFLPLHKSMWQNQKTWIQSASRTSKQTLLLKQHHESFSSRIFPAVQQITWIRAFVTWCKGEWNKVPSQLFSGQSLPPQHRQSGTGTLLSPSQADVHKGLAVVSD